METNYKRHRNRYVASVHVLIVLLCVAAMPSVISAQIAAQRKESASDVVAENHLIDEHNGKQIPIQQQIAVNKGTENHSRVNLGTNERLLRRKQQNNTQHQQQKVSVENLMKDVPREGNGGTAEQRYGNGGSTNFKPSGGGSTSTGTRNRGGGHGRRKKTSGTRISRNRGAGNNKKARQRGNVGAGGIKVKKRNRGGTRNRYGGGNNGGKNTYDRGGKPGKGQSGQGYKPFLGYYPDFDKEICVYNAQYPNYMRGPSGPDFYFSNTINECCRLHYKGMVSDCITMSTKYAKETNPTYWGHDGWHSPGWHAPVDKRQWGHDGWNSPSSWHAPVAKKPWEHDGWHVPSWHAPPTDMKQYQWDRCKRPPNVSNPPGGPGVIVNGHDYLHAGNGGWRLEANSNKGGGQRRDLQVRNNFNYCGTSWEDANSKCGRSCPNGVHSECPNGELCFADVDRCPSTSAGNGNNNGGGKGGSNPGSIMNQPGDPYWGCDEMWHGDRAWGGSWSGRAWGGDAWSSWNGGRSGKARK